MSRWLFNFGAAWLALAVAFGLHVVDEATHDFLSWYNPIARRIRAFTSPIPFPPTFTFWPWLVGLSALALVVFALTPFAFDRRASLRIPAALFALINVGNGLLHLSASAVLRKRVPGVLSSPLLLVTSLWLLFAAVRL